MSTNPISLDQVQPDGFFTRGLADADPAAIRVATSDRALSEQVLAAGASVYPAERLRNLIDPRS